MQSIRNLEILMNTLTTINCGASHQPRRLHPISLFAQVTSQQASGCLSVVCGSTSWFVYLQSGKLTFATNSMNPFERLDRCLTQLSDEIPALVSAVRSQARTLFESSLLNQSTVSADWLAIEWLVDQQYLNVDQAAQLIESLAKEVFESLLRVVEGTHELMAKSEIQGFPDLCALELRPIVEQCQVQLRRQSLMKSSTFLNTESDLMMNQRSRGSQSVSSQPRSAQSSSAKLSQPAISPPNGESSSTQSNLTRQYTIACIDDSPTVLQAIHSFLDDENLAIVMINDPLKALIQIMRCKPNLILLDVGMPNLDGYELCSMLRKHSSFKSIPIVMVTGHTGFIDRAKAKLVGASGYLTKPFTRTELTKMVFKYLA
jgi:two-component system, chemotaxis family, response regulator PixG